MRCILCEVKCCLRDARVVAYSWGGLPAGQRRGYSRRARFHESEEQPSVPEPGFLLLLIFFHSVAVVRAQLCSLMCLGFADVSASHSRTHRNQLLSELWSFTAYWAIEVESRWVKLVWNGKRNLISFIG